MSFYIEYYKEKDTDPMVFLQRFRCTTEPIGGGTEYDEEGELVSWDAAVAAIEIAKKHLGWHPASEPPKDEEEVIAAGDYSTTRAVFHEGKYYIAEYYHDPESLNCVLNGVEWWCYPPGKEK